jgi:hypothetical protein
MAAIVAECMHNYLLFGSVLQCTVVDPEKVHANTLKNANRKFVKVSATLGLLKFTTVHLQLPFSTYSIETQSTFRDLNHIGDTQILVPALATIDVQQVMAVPGVCCNQWLPAVVDKKHLLALLLITIPHFRWSDRVCVFVNKTGYQPRSFRLVFA